MGFVHTFVELEHHVQDDSDSLFERRYPSWELKFNDDKVCFWTRSDSKPPESRRTGDRAWVEFKVFGRVVGFDVARPGAQKPPPRPQGMPLLDDVESAISFLYESLDAFKDVLVQIDLEYARRSEAARA